MGFLDKSLRRSEESLADTVIGFVRDMGFDGELEKVEVTCAERVNFQHLGIKLTPSGKEAKFIHRCRNVWFISINRVGLNYAAIPEWDNLGLVDISAGLALSLIEEQHESDTQATGDDFLTPEAHNSSANSLLETSVGRRMLAEYLEPLTSVGVEVEAATRLIGPIVATILYEFGVYYTLEDEEIDLGSKWLGNTTPTTNRGKFLISQIDIRSKILRGLGITEQQIAEYWNQTFFERESVYAMSIVNAIRSVELLRQQNNELPQDELEHLVAAKAFALVLRVARDSEEVSLDEGAPLPPEALGRAVELLADWRVRVGSSRYLEFSMTRGATSLARQLLMKKL